MRMCRAASAFCYNTALTMPTPTSAALSRPRLRRYLEAASRAAQAAGSRIARHVGCPATVETKRSAIDLVTEIDRACELLIRRRLQRASPECGFLGEEYGEHPPHSPVRWIVDPLDGTNNFVHGLPLFGVSIALEDRGEIVAGVIYDPLRRELFTALKDGGAFLNGKPIRVSSTPTLARSLLSTGFSAKFLTQRQPYLGWFEACQRRSHGVRRLGSTVISLASIAAGRLDGFYEQDLWPWDVAAGLLLITEAGGRVSDFAGRPPRIADGRLVASNGKIHRELLQVLNHAQPTQRASVSRAASRGPLIAPLNMGIVHGSWVKAQGAVALEP